MLTCRNTCHWVAGARWDSVAGWRGPSKINWYGGRGERWVVCVCILSICVSCPFLVYLDCYSVIKRGNVNSLSGSERDTLWGESKDLFNYCFPWRLKWLHMVQKCGKQWRQTKQYKQLLTDRVNNLCRVTHNIRNDSVHVLQSIQRCCALASPSCLSVDDECPSQPREAITPQPRESTLPHQNGAAE